MLRYFNMLLSILDALSLLLFEEKALIGIARTLHLYKYADWIEGKSKPTD